MLTIPRAEIDSINDPAAALGVLTTSMSFPRQFEVLIVPLDRWRRGATVLRINPTFDPDDIIDGVEWITQTDNARLANIVVASVRPAKPPTTDEELINDGPILADDPYRWQVISDVASHRGIELLEWFIIGDRIDCPRSVLGDPPRW